ncbi:putative serine protease HtrA [Novipirellula aureliae]|uniref:Putative serine protease HtrA n=1 Tax=Novipirellula aureliae TaxID=2527966 RepID=A0A5C6DED6_9BACT|nr:S1C family serine protease [Novipirellula aureliae]TWU34565.1 putative serine protease HtrA [Novipirellula aureliae]
MNKMPYFARPTAMVFVFLATATNVCQAQPSLEQACEDAQARVVKVYGAGGIAGLEAYQSGFLISPEGHIATAWSYVLDVEPTVVLNDGQRFDSTIVGFEPALDLAVLKIEATGLPFFRIDDEIRVNWGDPVLAISNLFNIAAGQEPASVMQGSIASVSTLDARRGTFKTPYRGTVFILDLVANNPGAAGGALINGNGQLIGMLGKELRDRTTGVWLNYALPASTLRKTLGDIIAGRVTENIDPEEKMLPRDQSHSLATIGLILIPDILESTPAYVDDVAENSLAAKARLQPDDLILLINGRRIDGQRSIRQLLRTIDRRDPVELTIQRASEILSVMITP